MKIAFVILHYLAEKETIECVDSIMENVENPEKHIIIVDNASPNDSLKKINEHIKRSYPNNDKIMVLHNEKNVGFARGNNVGFLYAKNKLNADYIVALNNDTVITQSDFCEVVEAKYLVYSYAVLGPDIITADGYHQNPLPHRDWTRIRLKLFKIKAIVRLIDIHLLSIGPYILEKKRKHSERKETMIGDYSQVRLHGACLIFSPTYISKFDGFDDGTFLYMEEDLLQIHMDAINYVMMYTSDLKVYHKEDVSTNMMNVDSKERNIRFLKNLIHSTDVCIDRISNIKQGR